MIRRGVPPGTRLYLEKSVTPFFLRKSSSVSRRPLTSVAGERSIAKMASEYIVWERGLVREMDGEGGGMVREMKEMAYGFAQVLDGVGIPAHGILCGC